MFSIHYQADEPTYTVEFSDFSDITTTGGTLSEAFATACEALDLHLESLQKLNLPIPPAKHRLVVQSG